METITIEKSICNWMFALKVGFSTVVYVVRVVERDNIKALFDHYLAYL